MTDRELTKKAIAVYKKACADLEKLVKEQECPVYYGDYYMRAYFRSGDGSGVVKSGGDLLRDIIDGRINAKQPLRQATPAAVRKMKRKLVKEALETFRQNIDCASRTLVESEDKIRRLRKSGDLSDKEFVKLMKSR